MTTKTEQLQKRINAIYLAHKKEVDALPKTGPRGGVTVNAVEGWVQSPSANITRASNLSTNAHKFTAKIAKQFRGGFVCAVPACMVQDMLAAEIEIWSE